MNPFWLVVATLISNPSLAAPTAPASAEADPWDVIGSLKTAPDGYTHIADDGVVRSYDAKDVVIDYIALNNEQLKKMLATLPQPWQHELNHLHSVFDGVDGYDVKDERQLLDPPASLRRIVDHEASQSGNPEFRERSLLEGRDYYCVGQACTRPSACQFLGCRTCSYLDAVLPGGSGICV